MTKVNKCLHREKLLRLKSCIRGRVFVEHCPLQRRVVTLDHGEAVEGEDVPRPDPSVSQGVVSAICVEPRLEPDPGVHQLRPVRSLVTIITRVISMVIMMSMFT